MKKLVSTILIALLGALVQACGGGGGDAEYFVDEFGVTYACTENLNSNNPSNQREEAQWDSMCKPV